MAEAVCGAACIAEAAGIASSMSPHGSVSSLGGIHSRICLCVDLLCLKRKDWEGMPPWLGRDRQALHAPGGGGPKHARGLEHGRITSQVWTEAAHRNRRSHTAKTTKTDVALVIADSVSVVSERLGVYQLVAHHVSILPLL